MIEIISSMIATFMKSYKWSSLKVIHLIKPRVHEFETVISCCTMMGLALNSYSFKRDGDPYKKIWFRNFRVESAVLLLQKYEPNNGWNYCRKHIQMRTISSRANLNKANMAGLMTWPLCHLRINQTNGRSFAMYGHIFLVINMTCIPFLHYQQFLSL